MSNKGKKYVFIKNAPDKRKSRILGESIKEVNTL
jgi:hypothetical protein